MANSLIQWIVLAVVIGIAAFIVPGVEVSVIGALVAALVIAFINVFIKPVISALTLPVNVLTLGLFSIIVNALLLMLAAAVVPGFAISGFLAALVFAIVLALINVVFGTSDKSAAPLRV